MIHYKSPYQVIEFFEEERILAKRWFPQSVSMIDSVFKDEVLQIVKAVESTSAKGIYDDTTDFGFTISPEQQEWVDKEVFSKFIEAGVRRYALLVSSDFIAQLSIEQTMDTSSVFEFSYFDDIQKAMDWLKK